MLKHTSRFFVLVLFTAAVVSFGGQFALAAVQPVGDLIMYHDFENNLLDGVGNHNGTAQNGAGFAADTPNATAGSYSSSYDGVDDIIRYANSGGLDMNTGSPWSIALWIKPNTNAPKEGDEQAIFGKSPDGGTSGDDDGTHTPSLFYADRQVVYDVFWVGSISSPKGSVPTGTWTHIALTSDGTTTTLYVNGSFVGSKALTADGGVNEGDNGLDPWIMTTGDSLNDSTDWDEEELPFPPKLFDGKIDEFAFWTAALDAGQVADVYANGVEIPEPASLALLGLGGLAVIRRRRKK